MRNSTNIVAEKLVCAAQGLGQPWSAVRHPEENLADPHCAERGACVQVEHQSGGGLHLPGSPVSVHRELPWAPVYRGPLVGERTTAVLRGLTDAELLHLAEAAVMRPYHRLLVCGVSRGRCCLPSGPVRIRSCLLYTSDAADE